MSNETVEVKNQEQDHNSIIDQIIQKIDSNEFKIYYYCPPMSVASGGVSVIFKQVDILRKAGFNVSVIYEPRIDQRASYEESQKQKKQVQIYEVFNTSWLDPQLQYIEVLPLSPEEVVVFNNKTSVKPFQLVLNPEDFVVIPEGFPNVMEKVANIPCKKIVLAQSWYYIFNSLEIGQTWSQYGIKDVLSISQYITEYLNAFMPGLNIKNTSQSIDTKLFKRIPIPEKYPKIAFMPGRSIDSKMKVYNIIKTFYAAYPHFRWVRFDELQGLKKEEFAERLGEASFCLYTDDIAGFGTLPLEAMACGTHVVGWASMGGKEYMTPDNGFWANNGDIVQLATLIGIALEKLITGQLDSKEVLEEYDKTLSKYTEEVEKDLLIKNFNEYKNERIQELQQFKR